MPIPLYDLRTLSPEELGRKYTRREWEESKEILSRIKDLSEYEQASKPDPGKMSFLSPELWSTAAENILPSMKQAGRDILELPSALRTVATTDPRETASNVWEGVKSRYGGEEEIKRTIATDPFGLAMDIFPGTGGIARKVLGEGTRAGRLVGKLGDLGATDKLISAGKSVGKDLPIWASSHAVSALSGTDIGSLRNAWEQAMRGTPEAQKAFRESVLGTHELKPSDAVKSVTTDIQSQASHDAAFDAAKIGLHRQSPTVQSLRDEILTPIEDILSQEKIQFTPRGRAFSDAPITEESRGLSSIERAVDALKRSFDVSSGGVAPKTLDVLRDSRESIDKIWRTLPEGTHSRRIVADIRGNIDRYLKTIPGMAEADKKYATSQKLIGSLESSLKKKSADSRAAALAKAVYEQSEEATKTLADAEARTGTPLRAIAAGSDLSTTSPRGLVGKNALAGLLLHGGLIGAGTAAGNPLLGLAASGTALALSNPKNIGRGIASLGGKYQKIRPLHEAFRAGVQNPVTQALLRTLLYSGIQTSRNNP